MSDYNPPTNMRTFFTIWAGQLVSVLGSGLTGFALGVYIFQLTGSATQFGLVLLSGTLPAILAAPFAGALVDRWDRRTVMILSDTGNGLVTVSILALLLTDNLSVGFIYVIAAISSTLSTFQNPAYMAAITLIVPKQHYGRASGLMQMIGAITQVVTPLLAGVLIVTIKLEGILLIDIATYLVAMLTLFIVRIPRPPVSEAGKSSRGSLLKEAFFGWGYLRARTGLLGMLILFAFINIGLSFYNALLTPMILSFTTPDVLGAISSAGGIGLLIGSALMSAWGGAKRKMRSLIGSMIAFGFVISLMGVSANPWLIGAMQAAFFILLPIASGSSQAIWQAKIPPDLQGRVFSIRSVVASAMDPIALVTAGPLADFVFEPLMREGGALAPVFGPMIGVGPGRGIGLIFVIMGLFIVAANLVGYANPRIRLVEDEIPDFVGAPPESAESEPVPA